MSHELGGSTRREAHRPLVSQDSDPERAVERATNHGPVGRVPSVVPSGVLRRRAPRERTCWTSVRPVRPWISPSRLAAVPVIGTHFSGDPGGAFLRAFVLPEPHYVPAVHAEGLVYAPVTGHVPVEFWSPVFGVCPRLTTV